ncbi:GDP dissociation inhibitor-domain-containing protein [Phakopsora pachyrhizi]|uniref:GDP dissociation inhibitor-domain-containing protein n=1 Tax=Phakopsora pachyrhizi TaxID=170000 RepID=A0AAV0BFQ8_PHAPC|nr:GDP dissociation inhibitor-domain-containing protein [Phakopsora pachyrhizi]CAH7685048.1 GDP dissociation inhibitor-domain-containing protein [Phakopsora pachyrhizi]
MDVDKGVDKGVKDQRDRMDEGEFDYLVIGTGLSESILTRLLSGSASATVLQVDPNTRYGQSWTALQLDQLQSIGPSLPNSSLEIFDDIQDADYQIQSKKTSSEYALTLQPALVPARGGFIDLIVSSNVAPYLSFQLLNQFILAQEGDEEFLALPGSKHDLFKLQGLSLMDKRLLMRFFQSVIKSNNSSDQQMDSKLDYEISLKDHLERPPYSISNPKLISMIAALSLSPTSDAPAQAVIDRLMTIFRSIGRHPSSTSSVLPAALLIGEYGGGGEWVEGFVRSAAVTGNSVQVLGRPVISLKESTEDKKWIIRLGDQKDQSGLAEKELEFRAKHLCISEQYISILKPDLPPRKPLFYILRGIIILQGSALNLFEAEKDFSGEPRPENSLVVFPPTGECKNPVQALILGPHSGCCPIGQEVIYLSTIIENRQQKQDQISPDLEPKRLLKPFLDRLLIRSLKCSKSSTSKNRSVRLSLYYSQLIQKQLDEDIDEVAEEFECKTNIVPDWVNDLERSTLIEVVESLTEQIESIYESIIQ